MPSYLEIDPVLDSNRKYVLKVLPITSEELLIETLKHFPDSTELILRGPSKEAKDLEAKIIDHLLNH